jgi:hypothetical protein
LRAFRPIHPSTSSLIHGARSARSLLCLRLLPLLAAADWPRPQCANAFATQTQQQGRERSRFQCSTPTLSPPPQFHQHTAIWSWSSMVDLDRHESQHTHTAEERDVSTRHQHSTRRPGSRCGGRRNARSFFLCVCVDSDSPPVPLSFYRQSKTTTFPLL